MTYTIVPDKLRFIGLWRKEFGCTDDGLCWCDTAIKLGLLYDWFLDKIGTEIKGEETRGTIRRGSIGEVNLPSFMGDWLEKEKV